MQARKIKKRAVTHAPEIAPYKSCASRIIITSILCSFSTVTFCQQMLDILRRLPAEPVPLPMIDSLNKNGVYYPPDNTEDEATIYSLVDANDSILRIEMTFESGQKGFYRSELRRFKIQADEYLVIYSTVSGLPIAFEGTITSYTLKKGIALKDENSPLPLDLGIIDFVKPNTPDSIITKYRQFSNHCFELIHYGNNICYVLHENFEYYGIDKSWLLGNRIEFLFDKGRFKKSRPFFGPED